MAAIGSVLFAGSSGGLPACSVFRSTDDGLSWQNFVPDSSGGAYWDFAVIGNKILAVAPTLDTTFLSSDTGKTWQKQYIPSPALSSLAIYGSNIFVADAGIMGGGVLLSTDTGKSWQFIGYMHEVFSIYIFGDYIFAGAGQDIYRASLSDFVEETVHFSPLTTSKFNIIANPITSSADFQFSALQEPEPFALFDLLGRQFLRREVAAGETSLHLDMQQFPAGVYVARLGNETVRFVKL